MRAIPVYFKAVVRAGIGAIDSPRFGLVDFRTLPLSHAKKLWELGMPELRITPTGAQELYGDLSYDEVRDLVLKFRGEEEWNALAKAMQPEILTGKRPAPMIEGGLTEKPSDPSVSSSEVENTHDPAHPLDSARGDNSAADEVPVDKPKRSSKRGSRAAKE